MKSKSASQPVDLSAMALIFGEADRGLFKRILNNFVSPNNHAVVDGLCNAIDVGDIRISVAEAHKLKSAAKAIGAGEMAALCEEIERCGRGGGWPDRVDLQGQVRRRFSEIETYVLQFDENESPE